MESIRDSFVAKVLITTVLLVGGLVAANVLCPIPALYSVCVVIGLIPGAAFISWARHDSWRRFWAGIGFLLILAAAWSALEFFGREPPSGLMLLIVAFVALSERLVIDRIKRHRKGSGCRTT